MSTTYTVQHPRFGHIRFEARPNGEVYGGFMYSGAMNISRHTQWLRAAVAQVNCERGLSLTCDW